MDARIKAAADLLTNHFDRSELRELTYEVPQGRDLRYHLDTNEPYNACVQNLVEAAVRYGVLDDLIAAAARKRPVREHEFAGLLTHRDTSHHGAWFDHRESFVRGIQDCSASEVVDRLQHEIRRLRDGPIDWDYHRAAVELDESIKRLATFHSTFDNLYERISASSRGAPFPLGNIPEDQRLSEQEKLQALSKCLGPEWGRFIEILVGDVEAVGPNMRLGSVEALDEAIGSLGKRQQLRIEGIRARRELERGASDFDSPTWQRKLDAYQADHEPKPAPVEDLKRRRSAARFRGGVVPEPPADDDTSSQAERLRGFLAAMESRWEESWRHYDKAQAALKLGEEHAWVRAWTLRSAACAARFGKFNSPVATPEDRRRIDADSEQLHREHARHILRLRSQEERVQRARSAIFEGMWEQPDRTEMALSLTQAPLNRLSDAMLRCWIHPVLVAEVDEVVALAMWRRGQRVEATDLLFRWGSPLARSLWVESAGRGDLPENLPNLLGGWLDMSGHLGQCYARAETVAALLGELPWESFPRGSIDDDTGALNALLDGLERSAAALLEALVKPDWQPTVRGQVGSHPGYGGMEFVGKLLDHCIRHDSPIRVLKLVDRWIVQDVPHPVLVGVLRAFFAQVNRGLSADADEVRSLAHAVLGRALARQAAGVQFLPPTAALHLFTKEGAGLQADPHWLKSMLETARDDAEQVSVLKLMGDADLARSLVEAAALRLTSEPRISSDDLKVIGEHWDLLQPQHGPGLFEALERLLDSRPKIDVRASFFIGATSQAAVGLGTLANEYQRADKLLDRCITVDVRTSFTLINLPADQACTRFPASVGRLWQALEGTHHPRGLSVHEALAHATEVTLWIATSRHWKINDHWLMCLRRGLTSTDARTSRTAAEALVTAVRVQGWDQLQQLAGADTLVQHALADPRWPVRWRAQKAVALKPRGTTSIPTPPQGTTAPS
jgi:hypothetical protein